MEGTYLGKAVLVLTSEYVKEEEEQVELDHRAQLEPVYYFVPTTSPSTA